GPFAPPGAEIVLHGAVASTVAGAIDITANKDIQLDTTISSAGGRIEFHSPLLLAGDSAVNSGGGNVAFDSTVDSQTGTHHDLTVNGGTTGAVAFAAAVGAGVPLGNLTVAGDISLQSSVTAAGNIALTSTGLFTVNAPISSTDGGNIFLKSTVGAANDLVINAPVWATGGNGNISLNAGHDLIINHSSGADLEVQGSGIISG